MHRQLCEYECETTVSSFPFHGLLYFHVLWEYRKSHPKTKLLKEQFLLGKWNTHPEKCQNQAHSHVLHWNEHITRASVFDSVASYKCPSQNCHSAFIMWIHKNQLHGHQFSLGCISVDSSQRLYWEEVMSLPQLRNVWTLLHMNSTPSSPLWTCYPWIYKITFKTAGIIHLYNLLKNWVHTVWRNTLFYSF